MNPSHTFEIHTVTESSGERTVALMKNTNGVLLRAFCLACVVNGSLDDGRSVEDSEGRNCAASCERRCR